jgi:hypothetical protein
MEKPLTLPSRCRGVRGRRISSKYGCDALYTIRSTKVGGRFGKLGMVEGFILEVGKALANVVCQETLW